MTCVPAHKMVNNFVFDEDETAQADLCSAMAVVAEQNGMTVNDMQHLFPAVLKMLNDKSGWTK